MKKYLLALLFLSSFIHPCFANETVDEEYEELNAFGFPDKSFVKLIEGKKQNSQVIVNEKPDCSDESLIKKIREAARPFVASKSTTIVNRRRNILITKNIDKFSDLNTEDAYNLDNRVLKARLVELKINNSLDNKNFKICQSDNPILKNKLYLLMYDDNKDVIVELLNLNTDNIPTFTLSHN